MTKITPLKPEKLLRLLSHLGFHAVRRKGSHIFLQHSDGRATVVPFHKGEEIGRGLIRKVIADAKLSREEFLKALEEM